MNNPTGNAPISLLCGRFLTGDQRYFPQAEYCGQTVYFCTEYCWRAFLADPKRFSLVHRKPPINPTSR